MTVVHTRPPWVKKSAYLPLSFDSPHKAVALPVSLVYLDLPIMIMGLQHDGGSAAAWAAPAMRP